MQDFRMIEWLLHHANALEVAVAKYNNGNVKSVLIAKRKIFCLDDYKILRPWLRYRNTQREAVWIRPSVPEHSLLLLDDLPVKYAMQNIASQSLIVETSPQNAQVWIAANRSLARAERRSVLKALATQHNTDKAAVTDPRWGRLAGYKSGKKDCWTNIRAHIQADLLDPRPFLSAESTRPPNGGEKIGAGSYVAVRGTKHCSLLSALGRDDMSKREFAYACHALRAGLTKDEVIRRIEEHVRLTNRRKAKDYARKTVEAAQRALR